MKFKLLLYYGYYCYSMFRSFLFDFVHQLSSTASLSLSELSSAAMLCFVLFSLFCLLLCTMTII